VNVPVAIAMDLNRSGSEDKLKVRRYRKHFTVLPWQHFAIA
jgi:hypothetical protein